MNILVWFRNIPKLEDREIPIVIDNVKLTYLKMVSADILDRDPNGLPGIEHEDFPNIKFDYWFRIDDPAVAKTVIKWANITL